MELSRAASSEEVLEPDLPIVDAHMHFRDRPGHRYLFDEFLQDFPSGHNVRATVAIECGDMYRIDGQQEFASVGETEFLNGLAAMFASGKYGAIRPCAAIVGYADLRLGQRVQPVLDALAIAGGGRLRGLRNPVAWDASEALRVTRVGDRGMLGDPSFRDGFAQLARNQLSFDAWVYHTQLPEVLDLARAFPDTLIVLNHIGGPVGVGPYAGKRAEIFAYWSDRMRELAACANVVCKLGGLGMPSMGFGFNHRAVPANSSELAQAWRPYIEICIEAFGPDRCMFEGNFPPDKESCSYRTLWNALKRVAARYSDSEKTALFSGTASRIYRLSLPQE